MENEKDKRQPHLIIKASKGSGSQPGACVHLEVCSRMFGGTQKRSWIMAENIVLKKTGTIILANKSANMKGYNLWI